MARVLQLRKGTTQENNIFIGALGELTYDTDRGDLRIHDGDTRGGFSIPTVVSYISPTFQNDYKWFRVYSDGWMEQGGKIVATSSATVTLTAPMIDNNYPIFLQPSNAEGYQSNWVVRTNSATTTNFVIHSDYAGETTIFWEVKGRWK